MCGFESDVDTELVAVTGVLASLGVDEGENVESDVEGGSGDELRIGGLGGWGGEAGLGDGALEAKTVVAQQMLRGAGRTQQPPAFPHRRR